MLTSSVCLNGPILRQGSQRLSRSRRSGLLRRWAVIDVAAVISDMSACRPLAGRWMQRAPALIKLPPAGRSACGHVYLLSFRLTHVRCRWPSAIRNAPSRIASSGCCSSAHHPPAGRRYSMTAVG